MKSLTFILRFAIITVMILSSSCQKQTDYSADINALKATSNALRASRDSLAAALKITNANLLATSNALASLTNSITAIQTQLGVISGQITTLNTQLTATNTVITGHTATIATIQAQIKTIQDQITSLNSQQTSTSSLVSGLSNTVSSIQAQITTILASIDTLNSQQSTTSAGLADISAKLLLSNNQLTSLALAFNSLLTNLTIAPIITTTDPSAITSSTFTSGGNISNDGGSPVTARGVCWSTNQNPTLADSKTSDGTGKGTFTSAITGLASATTYYVRAYATNGIGTSYGAQITAITSSVLATVTTTALSSVTSTTATSGGNITNDGGAVITARGVCWSTSQNPTTANSKTTDGTGAGSFTSSITGLSPSMTYYVRAYAINSIGTTYGAQVTATAAAGPYMAYVFVDSNETAIRGALNTYMAGKGSTFKGFNTVPTAPSSVQATFDAQMNAYLSYPGWGTSEPGIFSAPIPTTSGGLDQYGVYISAYQFQTIQVPGSTLPTGTLAQYVIFVPIAALNGNHYTTIFGGNSVGGFTIYTISPLTINNNDLTVHYTGSANIPQGDYKIYTNLMTSFFRQSPNGSDVYFHGGALAPN